MSDDGIELSTMIYQLRSELSRAMWAGQNAGADIRFRADEVELELTIGLERSTDPKVAVRFLVLDMSAGRKQTSMTTQKITLRLKPVRADAPDESTLIDGPALPGED